MHASIIATALATLAFATPAEAIVPLGQFGEGPGDQAGLLEPALGVAIDAGGRVYVSEINRISVFSPRGAFLRAFGKDVVPGNANGEFEQCTTVCKDGVPGGEAGALNGAAGIATDPDGLLYVAEASNRRISLFDQQGRFLRAFGRDVDPTDAGTGLEVCTRRCQRGRLGSRSGELATPQSVTVAAGVVWVPDAALSRISVFRRDGRFLRAFGKNVNRFPGGRPDLCGSLCGAGVRSAEAGALSSPMAVALDAAGNILVTELGSNRVSVFAPNHAFARAFGTDVIPGNGQTGYEVCTLASGCKGGSTGAVFAPGGAPRPPANGPGVINQPTGIAVGPDGRVFVGEVANRRVSVFSPAPSFLGAFGKDVVPDNPVTGFEECAERCQRGPEGAGPGEMVNPSLMAFDCRGALYVAEDTNGRVERFGEPGTEEPPCIAPAALARPFGITKVRRHPSRGRATLTIRVPWSAELRLRGRGIRPQTRQVEFRRRARLVIRPTARTARRLRRHGRAAVKATVVYWPWGGARRTRTRHVVLLLRR
jgi:DNA-binding beta-propeller fold protein YncE